MGVLEAFTLDEVRQSFEIVALGGTTSRQGGTPDHAETALGLLVHVSSTSGRIIAPFASPYSAGKAALEAFAEKFSFELAPFGIDSIIVEPGAFATEGALTGSVIAFAADQDGIVAEYGDIATKPQEKVFTAIGQAINGPDAPDPQQVADAIADLLELPTGQRPLRTVVGTLPTAGLRELNEQYDKSRHQMFSSLGMT